MTKSEKKSGNADSVIETQLDERIEALEAEINGQVLTLCAPIQYGIDDLVRAAVESRVGNRRTKYPRLAVILETGGGYIEVAQRIVQVLRKHYREVDFIVPNHAMSAGTVLALSGDAVFMDYYSILGPIDPQIQRQGGSMLPALGYLEQYNRLIEKSKAGNLTTAELAYLMQNFDPAELYRFEQARELSISLLQEWLAQYKFKNWKTTKSKKTPVTMLMRRERAKEIAEILNNTQQWHSHGRGISMDVLRNKLKLEIDDFRQNRRLNDAVQSYYELLQHYMMRRGQQGVIHVAQKYTPISRHR